MKKKGIYTLFEWVGFIICLLGIYLDRYDHINFNTWIIFGGASITLIFYFIKKREEKKS